VPLAQRVAERTGVDAAVVAAVMAAQGVAAAAAPAAHRSLRVARLRLAGTKSAVSDAGPFDRTFEFPAGVVMVVGPNLRGKSSLLEIITLCLRGTSHNLQADVAAWLQAVECDIEMNGLAFGIRLVLADGTIGHGTIHQAPSLAELPGAVGSRTPLVDAGSASEYADAIEALMMGRLDLEPLHAADKQVGVQRHGWPSYFGSIYPPAGGDKVLIGETAMAGLAGRLLSVFLDLPRAAVLTRVRTAEASLRMAADTQSKGTPWTAHLRAEQEQQLRDAGEALSALPAAMGPSAAEAAARVAHLGGRLAEVDREWREFSQAYRQAKPARQEDERALNTLRETVVAARLFHGLDPANCPRCETPVAGERKAREGAEHACAVCSTPLEAYDEEGETQELIHEREEALVVSRGTEKEAMRLLEASEAEVSGLTDQLDQAETELAEARTARQTGDRVALEAAVARAEGALAVLAQAEDPETVEPDSTRAVLLALAHELDMESKAASAGLLDVLGDEIASLAREFGIDAVTDVHVDLRAALRIDKGGVAAGSFSAQSPGERLRLRIATVVALLRVGARRGIATHPGLLMLDSLRAEEVQESDAHAVLDALVTVTAETVGLQIITTSADETLPNGCLLEDHVLRPGANGALW